VPARALVLLVFYAQNSFYDDFSSTTLDPAWQVVAYTGPWPRAEGQTTPANHYELANGTLRYIVDPMTYSYGYVNDYKTYSPWYDYDPGLELHRTFEGDEWVFESKASYYIPDSNHRNFVTNVVFGDGLTGPTYYVTFSRGRDIGSNWYNFAIHFFDSSHTWAGASYTELAVVGDSLSTSDDSRHVRLVRSGGVLTALWSDNGVSWETIGTYDLGSQLDGLQQRVILAGSCWFNTVGSYAEWDSVQVTAVPEPSSIIALLGGMAGLIGLRRRKA